LNTSRQVGSAVGLAALVSVASAWAAGHGAPDSDEALTAGFGVGFLVAGAVLVVACVSALLMPPRPHATPTAHQAR
jgi:drug/metabolite transporter (DMT)-like permease